MDAILNALAATDVAAWLRVSRWGYAAINAGHIVGIAMLVGAILPLNLRLLGIWPNVPHTTLATVLVPVAAAGLALAVAMGTLLFIVRAPDYGGLGVFQAKMALAAIGTASALNCPNPASTGLGATPATTGYSLLPSAK